MSSDHIGAADMDSGTGSPGSRDPCADLSARLAEATSVPAAAEIVVDLLVERGFERPSVYLERGGRLRCVAQRGYWQIYDGLAPGAGVMGATFQRGRTVVLRDPDDRPDYLRAVPTARAEVCVPVQVLGRTAGIVNVQARSGLSDDNVARVEAVAGALGRRITELGGPPAEEPAELLARLGLELASLGDGDQIVRHALAAALTVSGMGGACLFLASGGSVSATADAGRLGPLLAALPQEIVAQLDGYVEEATSSYAAGLPDRALHEATSVLRDAGVASLVVLSLVAKGRREGVLVLVDSRPHPGLERVIPLLELLASTAAANIVAAEASAALHRSERVLAHQATHDPLTGVTNRASLLDQMRLAMADETARSRLVVLFVDLDGFKSVNDRFGHLAGDRLLVAVADRLRNAARDSDQVCRLGGDEFVVLCSGVGQLEAALAVTERVLNRLAAPFRIGDVSVSITACIGIAAASSHRSAEAVLDAADRAMYAAKSSGHGSWSVAGAVA